MVRDVIPTRLLKILWKSRENTEIDENLMKLLIFHDKSSGMCKIHSRFNVFDDVNEKSMNFFKIHDLDCENGPIGVPGWLYN